MTTAADWQTLKRNKLRRQKKNAKQREHWLANKDKYNAQRRSKKA